MRAFVIGCALVVSACASTGGLPREPFADIPVPASFIPYSGEWVMIRTPEATSAKLVYFTESPVQAALDEAGRLLVQQGWVEKSRERFVNPQGFAGARAEFAKGADLCRVTVIEGATATHADYTVSRVTRPR